MKITTLPIVAVLITLVMSSLAKADDASDPYAAIWKKHDKPLRSVTFEGTYVTSLSNDKPRPVNAKIDIEKNWYAGGMQFTTVDAQGNEAMILKQWGLDGKISWGAEQVGGETRHVTITPADPDPNESTAKTNLGIISLEMGYARRYLQLLQGQDGFDAKLVQDTASPSVLGRRTLTYEITGRGNTIRAVVDVDIKSDGVCIHQFQAFIKDMLVDESINENFQQVDGVWLPMKMTQKNYRGDKLARQASLQINKISLSPLNQADFGPMLAKGDAVTDTIAGLNYNFGQQPFQNPDNDNALKPLEDVAPLPPEAPVKTAEASPPKTTEIDKADIESSQPETASFNSLIGIVIATVVGTMILIIIARFVLLKSSK